MNIFSNIKSYPCGAVIQITEHIGRIKKFPVILKFINFILFYFLNKQFQILRISNKKKKN